MASPKVLCLSGCLAVEILLVFKIALAGKPCYKESPRKYCDTGWRTLKFAPINCFKMSTDTKNHADAEASCKGKGKHVDLLSPISKDQCEFLHDIVKPSRYWIGVTDHHDEQRWKLNSGITVDRLYFLVDSEGTGGRSENCIFTHWGKWADGACTDRFKYICHKESLTGPRETSFTAHFHSNKAFVGGMPAVFTCSCFNPPAGVIHWTIYGKDNKEADVESRKTDVSTALEYTDVGNYCAKRYTSELSFVTPLEETTLFVSCFCRPVTDGLTKCALHVTRLAYCGAAEVKVADGPKEKPKLTVSYRGAPGPVPRGETITLNCTVYPGKIGTLIWVANFHAKPRKLPHPSFKIVRTYEDKDELLGQMKSSVVEFRMMPGLTGIHVSCFSILMESRENPFECTDSYPFCSRTQDLFVEDPYIYDRRGTVLERFTNFFSGTTLYYLLIVPLAFIAILILAIPIAFFGEPDEGGEDLPAADRLKLLLSRWFRLGAKR